ncbi:DNA-binding GntR family transcriptional regulator [Brevibacterium sanguinis]|uniref:DNA-binding GntR family transcriptional regulator n=2 Tax=Brevibacterium TaxID=1696 RepID=A0A366IN02_9MICO|nr:MULTISPECIES: GntR family transcriptional regulator [Brevibacterium]RBP66078.1 DNA-binding GntR family transcriptional regulator [Brevibacterium sanguinis]RBP72729.1 DNA-binding GntR family transcriptional regulator [Brevibacterium celere]
MSQFHDTAKARFGGWSTSAKLPPGVRDPSVKAADYAYQYLKELIVTLQIAPQTIITETEVAAATGVSRTPVREAFFRLQAEKLLDLLPRRGASVPAISLRNIQEQAQTRLVLEGYGIEQICENKIPVADELTRLVNEQTGVLESDPDKIVEMVLIDKEFHWTLVKAMGNTEFAQLYNSLHDRQVRIGIAMFGAVSRRPCDAVNEHARIAEALADFDREEALRRLEYHLIGSLKQISGIFTN